MKLRNAMKDRNMKYPRVANRLLDLGMLLLVLGGIATCTVFLGMSTFFYSSFGVFIIGIFILMAAKFVSQLKNEPLVGASPDGPRLKLVK
jgi:hypothetical protein